MPPDVSGLYPRMRGADPADKVLKQPGRASTPAYAGLTSWSTSSPHSPSLYPRIREADTWNGHPGSSEVPLLPRVRG